MNAKVDELSNGYFGIKKQRTHILNRSNTKKDHIAQKLSGSCGRGGADSEAL